MSSARRSTAWLARARSSCRPTAASNRGCRSATCSACSMTTRRWHGAIDPGGRRPRPARSMRSTRCSTRRVALDRLRAWAAVGEPVVAELEALALERAELDALERLCASAASTRYRGSIGWPRQVPCWPAASTCCRPRQPALSLPAALIHQLWTPDPARESYLLAVGPREDMDELDATLAARKVHRVALPARPAAYRRRAASRPAASTGCDRSAHERRARRACDARRRAWRPCSAGRNGAGRVGGGTRARAAGHGTLRLDHGLVLGAGRRGIARGAGRAGPALPAAARRRAGRRSRAFGAAQSALGAALRDGDRHDGRTGRRRCGSQLAGRDPGAAACSASCSATSPKAPSSPSRASCSVAAFRHCDCCCPAGWQPWRLVSRSAAYSRARTSSRRYGCIHSRSRCPSWPWRSASASSR